MAHPNGDDGVCCKDRLAFVVREHQSVCLTTHLTPELDLNLRIRAHWDAGGIYTHTRVVEIAPNTRRTGVYVVAMWFDIARL